VNLYLLDYLTKKKYLYQNLSLKLVFQIKIDLEANIIHK